MMSYLIILSGIMLVSVIINEGLVSGNIAANEEAQSNSVRLQECVAVECTKNFTNSIEPSLINALGIRELKSDKRMESMFKYVRIRKETPCNNCTAIADIRVYKPNPNAGITFHSIFSLWTMTVLAKMAITA